MKGTGITKVLFLVALAGCVVYASILDKVDSLTVLKDDKRLGVTFKTGVLRRGEGGDKDKKVILKIFRRSVSYTKKEVIKRGKKEYQALMEIDSPYVIEAIEGEVDDGGYTLVEEYFDGYTIDDLPRKSYDVRDIQKILNQFGEGIHAIHKNEILHNNLHPQNLMIGNDNTQDIRVKIIGLDNWKRLRRSYVKCVDWERFGSGYVEYVDWERFGVSMYELFIGEEILCADSYLDLQNLDSRLSTLVYALCISKSIQTYDDYLSVLDDLDWETGGSLEMGMK